MAVTWLSSYTMPGPVGHNGAHSEVKSNPSKYWQKGKNDREIESFGRMCP